MIFDEPVIFKRFF